jgi:hypothetical protein
LWRTVVTQPTDHQFSPCQDTLHPHTPRPSRPPHTPRPTLPLTPHPLPERCPVRSMHRTRCIRQFFRHQAPGTRHKHQPDLMHVSHWRLRILDHVVSPTPPNKRISRLPVAILAPALSAQRNRFTVSARAYLQQWGQVQSTLRIWPRSTVVATLTPCLAMGILGTPRFSDRPVARTTPPQPHRPTQTTC